MPSLAAAACARCQTLESELALARPWRPEIPQVVFAPDPRFPVVVESPFAGDLAANARYLDACLLDALERGETPYASHRMLTRTLDDRDPNQRELGIMAGRRMAVVLRRVAFYLDRGMSPGMAGTERWLREHHPEVAIFQRRLGLAKGW